MVLSQWRRPQSRERRLQPGANRGKPAGNPVRASVAAGCRLLADLLSVAVGIGTERMRIDGRAVRRRILDLVRGRSLRGIESGQVPNTLRDFMIRARRIAADAKPADDFTVLV